MTLTTHFSTQNWTDHGEHIQLLTPNEFNFHEIIHFLNRTNNDPLNQIQDHTITKAVKFDAQPLLLQITANEDHNINIRCLNQNPTPTLHHQIAHYVWNWFDLTTDLKPFYAMAQHDQLLKPLVNQYYGLRIIGIPNLFEAITWAITGQLINIQFAYSLKRSLVENFGKKITYQNQDYWLYPTPDVIAQLTVPDLRQLKFTNRKAEYIIGVAHLIKSGALSKAKLLEINSLPEMQKTLLKIRGIGKWTANYVIMKSLKNTAAFPIEDVGLHNAIKKQLHLDAKPTIKEIQSLATHWKGWEAYATFYLWRSLYV